MRCSFNHLWQFLWSVAAGTAWTTSENCFGSHSLPMHLKQDRLTRLESQENRFSSFCFASLLLFCLFSCCCCCPCVVNHCVVVALLSNRVQEVLGNHSVFRPSQTCWKVESAQSSLASLKMAKSWRGDNGGNSGQNPNDNLQVLLCSANKSEIYVLVPYRGVD